uniref:C2 domain-containing protein n=1 Tax=Naja naja TaxID=35670 RepID=A0A8C6XDI3_NAJNA
MDSGGTSDPYVIVFLTSDIRKKYETKVHRKTLNPVYNESFIFQVGCKNVDLVISVWDRDKVTKDDQIGKLFLSCRATGNQLRHWSDMLANPRRPMAQWHSLQPVEDHSSEEDLNHCTGLFIEVLWGWRR